VTTYSKHAEPIAPNLLNREFTVSAPNIAWLTDITYLKVGRRWDYLTVSIDLFSRIIVGWDLSDSLERHSAIRAFHKALARRKPSPGLLVHSDRGIQFASYDFRAELKRHGCNQSMSRKGNYGDNAVAEPFFHPLKTQFIRHHLFSDRLEAELALFQYIEAYCNRMRIHPSKGWMSPPHSKRISSRRMSLTGVPL
jgi:putative transposase